MPALPVILQGRLCGTFVTMQSSGYRRIVMPILVLVPTSALAHSEEVLLVPVGILAAIGGVLLIARAWGLRWTAGMPGCALALVMAVVVGSMRGDVFPESVRYTAWWNALLGFVPSFLGGAVALLLFRVAKR